MKLALWTSVSLLESTFHTTGDDTMKKSVFLCIGEVTKNEYLLEIWSTILNQFMTIIENRDKQMKN